MRSSKRCILCKKELENGDEDLCKTCFEFLEWKYKNKRKPSLNHLRKIFKKKIKKSSGGGKK